MKNIVNSSYDPKIKGYKFPLLFSVFLFLLCHYSSFAQQGCLYKYTPGDNRIFITPRGVNKTYNDTGGPTINNPSGSITAPAYSGTAISGYQMYQYGPNDCVSPDPSTRSSQTSNCVIWDGDAAMYPGYLVNYVINCDLDDYVYLMLFASSYLGAHFLIKQRRGVQLSS